MLVNYLRWCWRLRTILPWSVRLVSDRELTQEEYNYPAHEPDPASIYVKQLWEEKEGIE